MLIRNLTIRTRLTLGFTIILVLLAIIGVVSIRNITVATKATENIYNHPFTVSNAVRDIKTNIIAIHRSMKDVALAENEMEMNRAKLLVDEYEKKAYEKFELVIDRFLGDKRDVQKALKSFSDWKIIREEVILLWADGKRNEAIAITKGKGAKHVEKVLADVEVMIDFASFKADEFYNITTSNEKHTYNLMMFILVIAFIITLAIIFILSRSILHPIAKLNSTARKIESGDLNARNTTTSKDELSSLAHSFNRMTDSIKSRTQILSGLTRISTGLHGISDKEDFTHTTLSVFKELTKVQFAVFYILDTESETFIPFDAIGADKQNLPTFSATNPPGDLGNTIHNKGVHIIRNIEDSNYFKYQSVVGELLMKEVITAPILNSGKVVAFLSCGVLDHFSNDSVEIFKQSVPIISSSYTTLIANQKTKEFSERIAKTNEELESQSEELQAQSVELKASRDSLQEQNVELEMQRKEVEEANRLKSEFLSNMSHELRTPLNSINALSKVLIMQSSEKLDEDESNYLTIIERNGKRLLSLINDILDLSKIEAGKIELNPTHFAANNFLSNIIENVRSLADEKSLKINLHVNDETEINSDEGRLYQVVTNVVGNAIKFTDEGEINLYCNETDDKITLNIQDTGIGISEDQLPFIFQEFRQVDGSTSRSYEGTGLGLAIVKKIIKQLKGDITCKSQVGVGSVFSIQIPKKWDIDIIQETVKTSKTIEAAEHKTILVVDDDPDFVNQLSSNFKDEGYNVLHATSGKEAIKMAMQYKPFVITLDIVMPEMDGWEVLLHLKKSKITSDIPVIIISNSEEADTGLALGAVGYIQKPVERKILVREIENINKMANNILIVDDNEVDILHLRNTLHAENYSISSCNSGKECLNILNTEMPDVLLLDLMMPEIDGFRVLKEIRQKEPLKDLPVIVVTAKDLSMEERKFLSERASSLVTKDMNSAYNIIHEIKRILLNLDNNNFTQQASIGKPNILIIEDNQSAVVQVQKVLEQAGLSVNHVYNGQAGLDFLEHTIPDGIILDLMMPGIDGLEVLQKIRQNKSTQNIPVIVLTAKNLSGDEYKKITQYEVQHLMLKGDIDVEELTNKVKNMIRPKDTKATLVDSTLLKSYTSETEIKHTDNNLPKLVLIEDNPDNRITIKAILKEYNIIDAKDGETGLQLVKKELPDLVLLDISLPKMDGFEVIKQIRNEESINKVPVIAVTAKAMVYDKEKILRAGCNDYVSKPINDDELRVKIKKYISNLM